MLVKGILYQWLKEHGFIGLKNNESKCYCHIESFGLFECAFDPLKCQTRKNIEDKPPGSAYGPKE